MPQFAVQRNDLRRTHWLERPSPALADGEVRVRVDTFALTSNNITYAAFGELMNYWQFFPTGEADSGCVPVWGFGSVSESRCAGIDIGDRFYGYWPLADEAVLAPVHVGAPGFTDGAPHRRGLPPVYNQYVRCSTDPGYVADLEPQQALLRPLFATSFLLDDFLADNEFFGADALLLSSASSKTSYGTAFCLAQRGSARPEIVGLTSAANLAYVRSLGCYDRVIGYDEIPDLTRQPSVYVDFSGGAALRAAVHNHLADALKYSCAIGATHWDDLGGAALPGPAPVLFFAPDQGAKRAAQWGADGLQQRIGDAWRAFMLPVTSVDDPWLTVVRADGRAAVEQVYGALLDGTVPAREGHVLSV